ncbi:MAG: PKD domain-containing protein, partial [bacterium]|nr:PKD domain-containing protein [bacterium]
CAISPNLNATPSPQQATFTAAPRSGPPPLTVTFTNTSSGTYTTTLWSFGDGTTGTLDSPAHTYTSIGAYTVTLTVSGTAGSDSETRTNYISVWEAVSRIYLPLILRDWPPQTSPQVAGCDVFPADNVWNTPIDTLPVDPNSDAYIATIGAGVHIHADFGSGDWPPGSGSPIGIPYVDVPGTQALVDVSFEYDDESDPGPYPIPPD